MKMAESFHHKIDEIVDEVRKTHPAFLSGLLWPTDRPQRSFMWAAKCFVLTHDFESHGGCFNDNIAVVV